MKNFKRNLICSLAIGFGICTAFTAEYKSVVSWRFTGNECNWQERVNPLYYVQETFTCPPGESHFCKIVTQNNNGKPLIPTQSEMYTRLINDEEDLPEPISEVIFLMD